MTKHFTIPDNEKLIVKNHKKKLASYTIREDVLDEFNAFTKESRHNKSGVVEQLIISFLTSNGVSIE